MPEARKTGCANYLLAEDSLWTASVLRPETRDTVEVEIRRVLGAEKREEKMAEPVKAWGHKHNGQIRTVRMYGEVQIDYGYGEWVPVEIREIEEPEPVNCECGKKPRLYGNDETDDAVGWWYVSCEENGEGWTECWQGPGKPTRREAVDAWNARMAK